MSRNSTVPMTWGEEVMPGVQMIARNHNPHVALAKLAQDEIAKGAPIMLELNYEKIYESIQELMELIDRLKSSNEYMESYLKENTRPNCSEGDEGTEEPRVVEEDDDIVVREAIDENKSIIVAKERELAELRQLTRMHKCGHDAKCAHHHHHHHEEIQDDHEERDEASNEAEHRDVEASDSSAAADEDEEAPFEGFDDSEATTTGAGNLSRFTL